MASKVQNVHSYRESTKKIHRENTQIAEYVVWQRIESTTNEVQEEQKARDTNRKSQDNPAEIF